jgi:hypothetical protein
MTVRSTLSKWLLATPLTGAPMLLCVVAALIAPTLIRASVQGLVEEAGFLTYLPFVLLAGLLLTWQVAAGVAAAGAGLGDFLFVGPRFQLVETPSDLFGITVFAVTSVLAIGLAHAFRRALKDPIHGPNEQSNGIVFSQEGGQVYASWYGGRSFVPIGPEGEVSRMMQDFLSQREVGERLARQARANRSSGVAPKP